jgi:thiamine-phosphate pyrophosphorylase
MATPPRAGRRLDLSLYLVTDTAMCGHLGVAATVEAAVAAGVTAVQLRDPDATDDELVRLGREVAATLRGTGVPLIVNDRIQLVEAIGADGAHVGQDDLDVAEARRRLGPDAVLGLSVQIVAHVDAAVRLGAQAGIGSRAVDYLGVGPVWWQTTKPDAAAPAGVDELRAIVAASPWPCVAIGGVTPERVPRIRWAGAAGIAVVSAICGQPDVSAATRSLRKSWDGTIAPIPRGRRTPDRTPTVNR